MGGLQPVEAFSCYADEDNPTYRDHYNRPAQLNSHITNGWFRGHGQYQWMNLADATTTAASAISALMIFHVWPLMAL